MQLFKKLILSKLNFLTCLVTELQKICAKTRFEENKRWKFNIIILHIDYCKFLCSLNTVH